LNFCGLNENPLCSGQWSGVVGPQPADWFAPLPALPSCEMGENTKALKLENDRFYTLSVGETCQESDLIKSPDICAQAAVSLGLPVDRREWSGSAPVSQVLSYCSFAMDAVGGQDVGTLQSPAADFASPVGLHFNFNNAGGGPGNDRRRSKRHRTSSGKEHLRSRGRSDSLCPVCVKSATLESNEFCSVPEVLHGTFAAVAGSQGVLPGSMIDAGSITCDPGYVFNPTGDFSCDCIGTTQCQALEDACVEPMSMWILDCPLEYAACAGSTACASEMAKIEVQPNAIATPEGIALEVCLHADYVFEVDPFPPCRNVCGEGYVVTREVQGCRMVPPPSRSLDVATKSVSIQKCEDMGAEVPETTSECPSIPVGTPCDDGFDATINDVCTDPVEPSCAGECMAGHTNIRPYSVHWYKTVHDDDDGAGPRWRAPVDGIPLSGQEAEDACAASGSRLCSYSELCPSGPGHLPALLPETFTDWVPFRDDATYGGRRWASTWSCDVHEVNYCSNSGSECCDHGWCTQPGADDCQAKAVEANGFTTSCKGTYACCAVGGAGAAVNSPVGKVSNSSHSSQILQGKWFQTEESAMAFFSRQSSEMACPPI
jgi:hypothetical protein